MKRFQNILLVIDPAGPSLNAVKTAGELAMANNADLTVLVLTEKLPGYLKRFAPPSLEQLKAQEIKNALDEIGSTFPKEISVTIKQATGKPFVEVVREVLKHHRDLVIKSARPENTTRSFLPSATDMHILRKCPCPVWLVKEEGAFKIQKILAAVDFNEIDPESDKDSEPLNRKILELAHSLSLKHNAKLHVVHAWEAIGEDLMRSTRVQSSDQELESYLNANHELHKTWLETLLGKAEAWMSEQNYASAETKVHLPKGNAGIEIPHIAKQINADLIVMGTLARTGISGVLMGNTAETVLNAIECSVLAIKQDTFKSPISLN